MKPYLELEKEEATELATSAAEPKKVKGFDKATYYLSYASAMLCCLGIFAMTCYITVGVIFRYALDAPILFIDEFSGYILVMIAFMGLAYTARINAHMRVDFVVIRLPKRVQLWIGLAGHVLGLVVVALVLWRGFSLWLSTVLRHETSVSVILVPLWIPRLFIWVGLTVFFLEIILKIINQYKAIQGRAIAEEFAGTGAFKIQPEKK